jgi:hypothetical protein
MNAFVFIECRNFSGLTEKYESYRKYLPGWKGLAVCAEVNKHHFPESERMIIPDIFSLAEYNTFMTSVRFWEDLSMYEHVLICQHDSGLLRTGIDKFLEFDYVGAPWPFCSYGGNGGLSLRRVSTMIEILNHFEYSASQGNEDIFFSSVMHDHGYKLASRSVCSEFSVESAFMLGTLGYHFGEDSKRYIGEREKEIILGQYG